MGAECPFPDRQQASFRELQQIQERKSNIAGIARQMLAGTFDYTEHDQLLDRLESPSTPLEEITTAWIDTGKAVRNAGIAVLVHTSVTDAVSGIPNKPPFGLVRSASTSDPRPGDPQSARFGTIYRPSNILLEELPDNNPFDTIRQAMQDTLRISLSSVITSSHQAAKENPNGLIVRDYIRYARWIDIRQKRLKQASGQIDVIGGGIDNTQSMMTKLLEATPLVVAREMGGSDVVENSEMVARNSDKFVTRLASLGLLPFLALRSSLAGPHNSYFLPASALRLVEDGEGLHLDFTKEQYYKGLHSITEKQMEDINASVRTNCPAMVVFEGAPSAIQANWSWNIDTARNIWERQAS